MIPLAVPNITEDELKAVVEVLKSGHLTHGPKNEELEKRFASYIGMKRAVTMNSCASALQLALEGQGIRGEVILPSFTFVASANAVSRAGAAPVFADIEYDTCNISPEAIEAKITSQTEAVMVVHFAGQSCRMDQIMKIADKHHLAVVEDSAETVGGEYKGRKTGSFGTGCFSFFPTKNMTTGEGGILTTNDDTLADKVKALIGHGIPSTTLDREKSSQPWARVAVIPGYNLRMSNLLAAIGVEQLKKLDEMNEKRRRHAAYFTQNLDNIPGIDLPVELSECRHVYQMYTIKVKNGERDSFVWRLREKGIGASVHFDPPVHCHPCYQKETFSRESLPVSEQVAKTIVTLPLYPQLTTQQLDEIITAVGSVISG